MKYSFYTLIVLSLLFCYSCRSRFETTIKFRKYTAKDSITINLKLYEANQKLNPLLDSLIFMVEECPEFQNMLNDFSYTAFYDGSQLRVAIGNIPGRHSNYGERNGLFFHKGYAFYCEGIMPKAFFTFKNEYVEIRCLNPKKFILDMIPNRGKSSYWWYVYENNELKNIESADYCKRVPRN